jgi:hypothetical protein
MKIKLESWLAASLSRYPRLWAGGGILLLFIGLYFFQVSNLSSLNTGIKALESSATVTSKATIIQRIATLEKQIKSLPETLPTKKELNQQLADWQQEIHTFPDNSISFKDRLSLQKDRLSLEKDLATARNAILGTLLQAVSAIFFAFTAYFTWRNVKAAEEKQITERFSKAVELLGSDKIEIRLGGIYALERIAKDSPKDHWTIMEVLTSFIREKSPLEQKPRNKPFIQEYFNQISQSNPQDNTLPKIATDVQAALTVIGRRNFKEDKGKLNLRSTNLSQADLFKAHLKRADLSKAHLKETNLWEAHLEGAELVEVHMEGAHLRKVNMEGAN